jgi:hypothetical protein
VTPSPTPSHAPEPSRTPTSVPEPTATFTLEPTPRGNALPDPEPRFATSGTVEYDAPLVLQGDEELEFTGQHVRFLANVTLHGQARLVFRESLVEFVQGFAHQSSLTAHDDAQVVVEHSDLKHEHPMNWDFRERAALTMLDVRKLGTGPWPWMTFGDEASGAVRDSEFDGTIWDRGTLDISGSPATYLELVFPTGAQVNERLTVDLSDYTFPGPDELNINYRVNIRDTTMRGWGITVLPESNVTLRDAHNVVMTLQVNDPLEDATVELEDLRAQRYDDHTMAFGGGTLRLINVDIWQWSPTAFRNNTLIIQRSDLADIAFVGQSAKVEIEDSNIYFLRARESVHMTTTNSLIYADVIAQDDGVITLINTEVRGSIVELGNGKVFVR